MRSTRKIRWIGIGLALLLVTTDAAVAKKKGSVGGAAETRTRLRGKLSGAAIGGVTPSGNARFQQRSDRMKASVEVEDVSLAEGTALDLWHNTGSNTPCAGTRLGTEALDGFGGADLNLDDRRGDTVPVMIAGDFISVCQGATPLLSGSLAVK
jgi:hypothetical protein